MNQASMYLSKALKTNKSKFHFLNSFIHGASNFGGTLLPIYSSSVYCEKIRALKCTSVFIHSLEYESWCLFFKKSSILQWCNNYAFLSFLLLGCGRQHYNKGCIQDFLLAGESFFWCTGLVFLARWMIQVN